MFLFSDEKIANFILSLFPFPRIPYSTFLISVDQNKNLGEESSRYWHVILNKTFDFSRYQKIAEHVKKHTKLQVLRFYDKYVAPNAPCRHKLCVHVVAKQHEEEETKASAEPTEEKQKEAETSSSAAKKERKASILIENAVEFRRSMPLFSMSPKMDVEVIDLGINTKVAEKTE
jgi:secreted Zn-dependent insulinase-like peptidase